MIKLNYLNAYLLSLTFKSIILSLSIYFFTIYFLYLIIAQLFGKTIFEIRGNCLIVRSYLYILTKADTFDINEIKNIRIEETNSSNYWGFAGFRFYSKVYQLTFKYKNKTIQFGDVLYKSDLIKIQTLIDNRI